MSVDVSARIVYGFILSDEEYDEYYDRCEEEDRDTSEFCHYINSYAYSSDGFFGVSIDSTDYHTSINKINGYDIEEWERCLAEWKKDFPDRADEEPEYFLICQWW